MNMNEAWIEKKQMIRKQFLKFWNICLGMGNFCYSLV